MANYTLIARINAGNGKFPFVTVQFTKNHRPIPIAGATYYLRPCNRGSRTPPIRIGKDVNAAMAALLKAENAQASGNVVAERAGSVSSASAIVLRKTVAEAAQEYIERSREKSRRTFIGYRTAVSLFLQSCTKQYFDEIRRDDMLDYLRFLRNCKSLKTNGRFGESTVFNYFLKTMVFLNDRGIAKHVAKEDWVQKKDWPINVDKRNKNRKYSTYLEEEEKLFSTRLVEAPFRVVYISNRMDRCSRAAAGTPSKMLVRPVAIRRNPGFDVFNVRLLISLDKFPREKRRYQGDLSASINDALLAVNLNTVKLVTLQGKKKQTARETQVVLLRRLIHRIKRIADARGCSINQLVNSGLLAFYSKTGRGKVAVESSASRGSSMASYDKMSAAERQQLMEALASLTGLQEGPDEAFPDTRYAYDPALKRTVEITPSGSGTR